jgi:hypothetical protein
MAAAAAAPEAVDAIHAEFQAADGLVALPGDARRCHVHYTHCRTDNPEHVQPHDLTREDFWNHLKHACTWHIAGLLDDLLPLDLAAPRSPSQLWPLSPSHRNEVACTFRTRDFWMTSFHLISRHPSAFAMRSLRFVLMAATAWSLNLRLRPRVSTAPVWVFPVMAFRTALREGPMASSSARPACNISKISFVLCPCECAPRICASSSELSWGAMLPTLSFLQNEM